ncbi:cobalt ECF transporter T component CbiQ [soil metagenome]
MGAGHSHPLYIHGDSPVHDLAPQVKVVAVLAFVVAVVLAPREALWVFAVAAALVAATARLAGIPGRVLARRLLFETPFVIFAVLLPVIGAGERIEVLWFSLSVEGLWGAWNIIAKATLGLGATLLLTATTEVPKLLAGLERLHLPAILTGIAGFMVRYTDLLADDLRRMRIARASRGDDPRWLWQAGGIAATAGALFLRSFERGERVFLAMQSRGFVGTWPDATLAPAPPGAWLAALTVPAVVAACTTVALFR